MARLAIVGAGVMGEALARGLLGAGWAPEDLVLADVRAEHLEAVSRRLGGVPTASGNREAASRASGVLLAVKPQDAGAVLGELRGALAQGAAVISIVAGLRLERIAAALGGEVAAVRAMPNTPAQVGAGVTALAAAASAGEEARGLAESVFSAVGPVVWVPEEYLDAVTALSGSGPAYVFLVAEAMVDAGVTLGLPRGVAETLAYATVFGSGKMLLEGGEHPAVLRARVTSPGGTTAAALAVLEGMAVRAAFVEAIRAAFRRARELG